MTDITELALRLKLEVHLAVSNFNPQMNIKTRDLNVLVEALEKAQAENTAGVAGMAESYETTISMLRSRIAELESRTVTVKLPQAVSAGGQGYQEQVERILTAAGIKVEAG
ncbi:hypothetical protein JMX02_15220 [Klebsiella pneumoniae]|uniref:hypothetical protein n=1 Tax=Klebsiella pneumoniae TaxID=573 RepID=UPI0014958270|nr:hypothetical protein [Klebsiella pneumoniae]UZH17953.1 hypothetical protein JMX02_15220 [Klebsiella pneumoniae]